MFRFVVSIVAVSIASIAPRAFAATIYDSSATFLPLVAPGAFLNTFSTGGSTADPPISFPSIPYAGSGFSYTVTSDTSGVFADNATVGNFAAADPVVITFTGNPVTAIGGNFFFTNISGTFFADFPISVQLSDGTNDSFTAASTSAYRGYISTEPITSMTFVPTTRFYNIDNLTVGSAIAVPEPTTLSLVATVGAVAWYVRRRRTRRVVNAS